jgi:hypothetical protein
VRGVEGRWTCGIADGEGASHNQKDKVRSSEILDGMCELLRRAGVHELARRTAGICQTLDPCLLSKFIHCPGPMTPLLIRLNFGACLPPFCAHVVT